MAPVANFYRGRVDGGSSSANPASRLTVDYIRVVKDFRDAASEFENFDYVNELRKSYAEKVAEWKNSYEVRKRRVELEGLIPEHGSSFKLDVALLEFLLIYTKYPHDARFLAASLARGVENPADIPYLGIGRKTEKHEPKKAAQNKRRKVQLRFEKPNSADEHLAELEKQMLDDIKDGHCSNVFTYEETKTCTSKLAYAFPVLKPKWNSDSQTWTDKARPCVDERAKNADCMTSSEIQLDDLRATLEAITILALPREYLEEGAFEGLLQLPRNSNVDFVRSQEHKFLVWNCPHIVSI